MYPENNQQQSYSVDYLNQIAPQGPKRSFGGPFFKIFVGLGIAIVVVVILVIVANLGRSGQSASLERLAARLSSTATIVTDAQDNLASSKLRTANSNLSLYLTNSLRDLTPLLEARNVSLEKLPANITRDEDTTDLTNTLEDARLNGIYDSVYSRELSYRLQTIVFLVDQLRDRTTDQATKDFLEAARENLQPIQTQLQTYAG